MTDDTDNPDEIDLDEIDETVKSRLRAEIEDRGLDPSDVFQHIADEGLDSVRGLLAPSNHKSTDPRRPPEDFNRQARRLVWRELGFTRADRIADVMSGRIGRTVSAMINMRYNDGTTSELAELYKSEDELDFLINDVLDSLADDLTVPRKRTELATHLAMALGRVDADGRRDPSTPERKSDPHAGHYQYVDRVLGAEAQEVGNQHRDQLARRIMEVCQTLTDRHIPEHQPDESATGPPDLLPPITDGLLWLDKAGIEWMDEVTNGGIWGTVIEANRTSVESSYRDLIHDYQQHDVGGREALSLWFDPDEPVPTILKPVLRVGECLWQEEIRPKWQRQQTAGDPLVEQVGGDDHARMGQEYAPMVRTFGGRGRVIEVGNNEYGQSAVAPFHPNSMLKHCKTVGKYYQTSLPLELADVSMEPGETVDSILSVHESKLFVRFALESRRGGQRDRQYDGEATIRQLAREIYPHYEEIKKREYERVARSARRIEEDIKLRIPYDSGWNRVSPFIIEHPDNLDNIDPDRPIRWMASPQLFENLQESPFTDAAGGFVFNKSAFMQFDGRKQGAQDVRAYLVATAMFNRFRNLDTGNVHRGELPEYDAAEWAAETGAFSEAGWRYHQDDETTSRDDRSGYNAHRKGRDRAWQSLQRLEDRGLVCIEGDRDSFQLLPPEELNVAWDRFREALSDRF